MLFTLTAEGKTSSRPNCILGTGKGVLIEDGQENTLMTLHLSGFQNSSGVSVNKGKLNVIEVEKIDNCSQYGVELKETNGNTVSGLTQNYPEKNK